MRIPILVATAALAALGCDRVPTEQVRVSTAAPSTTQALAAAEGGEKGYGGTVQPGGPAATATPKADQPQAAPARAPTAAETARPATADDRQLIERFRAAAGRDLTRDLQVAVEGGVLHLRGQIANEAQRKRLVQKAYQTMCEDKVADELTVGAKVGQVRARRPAQVATVPEAEPEPAVEEPVAPPAPPPIAEAPEPEPMRQEPVAAGPMEPMAPAPAAPRPDRPTHLRTPHGMSVLGGGGVGGFTDEDVRDSTNLAGKYNVRMIYGTRARVGVEAAYVGSAQSIDAFGLDNDALLFGNGLEVAGRVHLTRGDVQPYVSGGVGWTHYNVDADFNTSSVKDDDDLLAVPLAVGLSWRKKGFVLDGRGSITPQFGEDLIGGQGLHTWGATLQLGTEF